MKATHALVAALFYAGPVAAQAPPSFPLSFEQFRRSFDENIRQDTLPPNPANAFTTKSCQRRNNRYDCTFNETGFQNALKAWRTRGLFDATGRVPHMLSLSATISGGQVNRIVVTSVRDDMINLIVAYLPTVVAVMRVFEPGIAEGPGEPQTTVQRLGIMRGDVDPTIGRPVSMTITGAQVTCTNWDTDITPKVECVFTPL